MWMVESNEHGNNLKMSTDLIHSRKLRPVVPRSCSSIQNHTFSTITTPCCFCVQNPSHHSWNHNNLISSDVTSRDHYGVYKRQTLLPLVSSSTTRWNPTGEQLQALEEMYRRGLRTPTAEQIQQIASKLRRYGRIEGKNVFYWFQNHKARERQKIKRRQLNNNQPPPANKKMRHLDHHTLHAKPTGLDGKSFETGNPNKLLTLSSCTTPSQGGAGIADGWIGLNQKELHQKQQAILTTDNRNEKCWQLNLSSSSTEHKTTAERDSGQENSNPFDTLNLSLLLMTPKNFEGGIKENQTLELFPVRCNDLETSTLNGFEQEEETYQDVATTPTRFAAKEFIEFLPTKC